MKTCFPTCSFIALLVITLFGAPFHAYAQSSPPVIPLGLEVSTNGTTLTVGSLSQTGALFLQMAADLQTLLTNPFPLFQTNTPLTNDLRLSVVATNGVSTQAFFSALLFPGQSVDDFGDPEAYTPAPDPTDILFSSGLPTSLVSGQTFPIVFFVSNPTGQPVPLTGTATIMVVSVSDGTSHPDATVTPPTGQMTNGFLQMQITVNAVSSLTGYTLALSIDTAPQGAIRPRLQDPIVLPDSCDLGPIPLQIQQSTYYYEELAQRRTANTDGGTTWDNPLAGGYNRVAGTYGEWRGDSNTRCHFGLDLAAPIMPPIPLVADVLASRSGVVSCVSTNNTIGAYVVIDHGNGWFSRYVHLAPGHILVTLGHPVSRGTPLANQLFTKPGWGPHLHFEILYDSQQMPHWYSSLVGNSQDLAHVISHDPVRDPGINWVPPANNLPEIDIFGLTGQAPWETVFQKAAPSGVVNSPVYVFVKTSDQETYTVPSSGKNNPGPRSVSFWPEGAANPQTIAPSDYTYVQTYIPLSYYEGADPNEGFALYKLPPDVVDRGNYFRYWFLWDTSAYATSRVGPRSCTTSVRGYSGLTTNYTFTFGPQVKGSSIVPGPEGGQQFMFTNVAYLGTNLMANPSLPDLSQPDRYLLQIINTTNDQPLTDDLKWSPPLAGGYTSLVNVHTNEQVYKFTLPPNYDPGGLTLRVSSQLVPDIAHEVKMWPLAALAILENDGSLTKYFQVEFKGVLADESEFYETANVLLTAYDTTYIGPVTVPLSQIRSNLCLNIYGYTGANTSWAFGVDLKPGWEFVSVYSDKDYKVIPLNGATSYYDMFYQLGFQTKSADFFTVRSQ